MKFFPKSFKMVKERIKEIRNMTPEERNADTEYCNIQTAEKPNGILSRIKASIDGYFNRLSYGSDDYNANIENNLYKQGVYRTIDGSY